MFPHNYYVYILQSISEPAQKYIGFSENIRTRLFDHNNGRSVHTASFRPWKLKAYFAFDDKLTALNFEQYLKSSSGRAFSRKHFGI